MQMTDKSKNDTPTGASTEQTRERSLWSPRLGRAILYRFAKDMGDAKPTWLRTDHVRAYCQDSGIDHEEYCKAIEYMAGKSVVQKKFMLASLRKNLKMS